MRAGGARDEPANRSLPANRSPRLLAPFALGAACVASAALLLWLNRDTTFFVDELVWFANLAQPHDPTLILHPHNSHLIGTVRLIYLAVMEAVGPDYIIIRVLSVLSVILCSTLLYVWARKRIGPVWALLPSILLLFYGSAWQHVVDPIGFTITFSIAAGLAALLALERDDRKGDVLACAFVSLSVFTYTVGLGYLVGVGISVLLRRDRFRRAWIFLIPLLLYAAWWLWAQQFSQDRTSIGDPGHVISFFAHSLAVVSGALSGVAIPFSRFGELSPVLFAPPGALGWIVAAALLAWVGWRILRGTFSPTIWASIGVVATYWLAAALADTLFIGTQVEAVRYVFPGSVGVLLVLVDAGKGARIRGGWAVALVSVFAFSLVMNLVFLRDGAAFVRTHAAVAKTRLAMLELANGTLPGGGLRDRQVEIRSQLAADIRFLLGTDRDEYLTVAARYGSPAYDLDEIRALPASDRLGADETLLESYGYEPLLESGGFELPPAGPPPDRSGCKVVSRSDGPIAIPPRGIVVRPASAVLTPYLHRFSDPPGTPLGALTGGAWSALRFPADQAEEPWILTVGGGSALICPAG